MSTVLVVTVLQTFILLSVRPSSCWWCFPLSNHTVQWLLYHVLLDDAGKLRLDPDGSVAWRIASRIARALDGRPRDLISTPAIPAAAGGVGMGAAAETSGTTAALMTSGSAGDVNATDPPQILERRDRLPPSTLFILSAFRSCGCMVF